MKRYASNGTIRAGSGSDGTPAARIAEATDMTIASQANAEMVITTSGEGGPTSGIKTVKVTGKCAVPRQSTERKRLVRMYQADAIFRIFYRSGDMEFVAEGIIDSLTFTSSTNKKDEFDFEFMGIEMPVLDV